MTFEVAVVGGGPVGLAAGAHLASRGMDFVVLEAGERIAVADWAHVRLFSPWRFNIDPAARELLEASGWRVPDMDALPTGGELIDDYLDPLAARLAEHIRYGTKVTAIVKQGFDRVRTAGRDEAPFLLRLSDGSEITARAVIDASGTWRTPNPVGGMGLAAYGEDDARAAGRVFDGMPDVLEALRDQFEGGSVAVVGSGHSASGTLIALAELGVPVTWVLRAPNPDRSYGGGAADSLPARGAIGARVRKLVEAEKIDVRTQFLVQEITGAGLVSTDGRKVEAAAIVNATGARPDHQVAAELRLDLDPVLESTRALAPLIDPNVHSCGTVPPHGVDELTHPENGYYIVGAKSYGRAPTFLLATGYEQVRSVVAALAGDWDAARNLQLDLPATGVCSSSRSLPLLEKTVGCC